MCDELKDPVDAVSDALGAPYPDYPIYSIITKIATQISDTELVNAFVPVPYHTRYVSPSWKLSGVVPLPFGYYTTIADAYASIIAETPVPLASDKYQIIVNSGQYTEGVLLVSNVDIIGTDRDSVFLDSAVILSVGSGVNLSALDVDESVSISNLTLTGGISATVNPLKNTSILAHTLRLENVNTSAGANLSSGINTVIKNSILADSWSAIGSSTTTIITGCVADETWSLSATLGSTSYIFNTTYPNGALTTDATSGIDREYTLISSVTTEGAGSVITVPIPVNYVNPTYYATVEGTRTNPPLPVSTAVGAKTINSFDLAASAITVVDILLIQPYDILILG